MIEHVEPAEGDQQVPVKIVQVGFLEGYFKSFAVTAMNIFFLACCMGTALGISAMAYRAFDKSIPALCIGAAMAIIALVASSDIL